MGGVELYCQRWRPDGESRGAVAVVHGVGGHSGRYVHVVDELTAHGYTVAGYDQRGFGRSPGQRGHINRWEEYREDLDAFLDWVVEEGEARPLFLYGHSMGALVALDYLLCHQERLRGAVICGAPIEPGSVAEPCRVALARGLSRIAPRFAFGLGLDTSALSRDPTVVSAYEEDPLVSRRVTVRWGSESLETVSRVRARAADIAVPILFIHGEADRLNLARGVRPFLDAIPIADKTLKIYPGGYHEPHNDINHKQVVTDVAEWLDRHC